MAAPEQPLPMSRGCQSSASLSPSRGDRTLLVRHLPAELTAEEKEDLLKYFGAQSVRVLSDKGRLVRAPSRRRLRPGGGRRARVGGPRPGPSASLACRGRGGQLESGLVTAPRKREREGPKNGTWLSRVPFPDPSGESPNSSELGGVSPRLPTLRNMDQKTFKKSCFIDKPVLRQSIEREERDCSSNFESTSYRISILCA